MDTVIASDGQRLPLDSLAQTFSYSGNQISSISVQYPNLAGVLTTYKQTFTYSGTNLIDSSNWVAQ